jgi:hypothetical protein
MRLSNQALQEFKSLYQKECGIALSEDQAAEEGMRFLQLFRLLSRPVPGQARSMTSQASSQEASLTGSDHE